MIMKDRTLTVPAFSKTCSDEKQIPMDELANTFRKRFDAIPEFVTALKAADNDGWQHLINEMKAHVEKDSRLSEFIRVENREGRDVVRIGEPNFAAHAVGAFVVGYLIGTACFELGPCDFSG